MNSKSKKMAIAVIGVVTFLSVVKGYCEDMKKNSKTEEEILTTSSDRNAPAPVLPLSDGDMSYEASSSDHGTLVAKNKKTKKEIWKAFLTDYLIDPKLELDVQEVYISSLDFNSEKTEVIVGDEAGTSYLVDIKTGNYKISTFPVQIQFVEKKAADTNWKYKVQIKIVNNRKKTIQLDGPSVAESGELFNNLFEVMVDDKPVPYRGIMAKRARPSKFIELKPQMEHKTVIDLGEHYPIASGAHQVKIRFKHTNHFSPDNFKMISPWIEVKF